MSLHCLALASSPCQLHPEVCGTPENPLRLKPKWFCCLSAYARAPGTCHGNDVVSLLVEASFPPWVLGQTPLLRSMAAVSVPGILETLLPGRVIEPAHTLLTVRSPGSHSPSLGLSSVK